MITRARLEPIFRLNEAADARAIAAAEQAFGRALPDDYAAFLEISNGLYTGDRLVLLEAEDIAGRNRDYDVQDYLPGYVMIGDDSGGTAILMKDGEATIFEVGMGAMDEDMMEVSAASLEQLLVEFGGHVLGQRPRG